MLNLIQVGGKATTPFENREGEILAKARKGSATFVKVRWGDWPPSWHRVHSLENGEISVYAMAVGIFSLISDLEARASHA